MHGIRTRILLVLALVLAALAAGPSRLSATWLYVSDGNQIWKVDAASGAVLGLFTPAISPDTFIGTLLFDRAGDLLAATDLGDTGGAGNVVRIDGVTGAVRGTFVATGSGGLRNPGGMAFGADGNLYVLDQFADHQWVVRRYDGESGASLGTVITLNSDFVSAPVIGPDGTLYLTDNDLGAVRKINSATGQPLGLVGAANSVPGAYGLALGPDGLLYVAGYDPPAVIRVLNPTTGALVREIDARNLARAKTLLFAPDGTLFITTPDVPPGGLQTLSPSGTVTQLIPDSTFLVVEGAAFACNPQFDQACLLGGRFRAQVAWQTQSPHQAGSGIPIRYSDDTSEFWFFDPGNLEMVVKGINGCALNDHFWVFAGGLTNVAASLTVTDTQTGISKVYNNPQGTPFKPIQDTTAFATCP